MYRKKLVGFIMGVIMLPFCASAQPENPPRDPDVGNKAPTRPKVSVDYKEPDNMFSIRFDYAANSIEIYIYKNGSLIEMIDASNVVNGTIFKYQLIGPGYYVVCMKIEDEECAIFEESIE